MRALTAVIFFLAGPCLAEPCRPFIEEHREGTAVSLRPHSTSFQRCTVDEEAYQRVVAEWLSTRPASAPVTSISLGRAVDYPWISRHLADAALADRAWRAQAVRLGPGARDRTLAALLKQPQLMQRLAQPFEGTRYEVASVSYEKVLWRGEGGAPVPFDAQLWLRLAPR